MPAEAIIFPDMSETQVCTVEEVTEKIFMKSSDNIIKEGDIEVLTIKDNAKTHSIKEDENESLGKNLEVKFSNENDSQKVVNNDIEVLNLEEDVVPKPTIVKVLEKVSKDIKNDDKENEDKKVVDNATEKLLLDDVEVLTIDISDERIPEKRAEKIGKKDSGQKARRRRTVRKSTGVGGKAPHLVVAFQPIRKTLPLANQNKIQKTKKVIECVQIDDEEDDDDIQVIETDPFDDVEVVVDEQTDGFCDVCGLYLENIDLMESHHEVVHSLVTCKWCNIRMGVKEIKEHIGRNACNTFNKLLGSHCSIHSMIETEEMATQAKYRKCRPHRCDTCSQRYDLITLRDWSEDSQAYVCPSCLHGRVSAPAPASAPAPILSKDRAKTLPLPKISSPSIVSQKPSTSVPEALRSNSALTVSRVLENDLVPKPSSSPVATVSDGEVVEVDVIPEIRKVARKSTRAPVNPKKEVFISKNYNVETKENVVKNESSNNGENMDLHVDNTVVNDSMIEQRKVARKSTKPPSNPKLKVDLNVNEMNNSMNNTDFDVISEVLIDDESTKTPNTKEMSSNKVLTKEKESLIVESVKNIKNPHDSTLDKSSYKQMPEEITIDEDISNSNEDSGYKSEIVCEEMKFDVNGSKKSEEATIEEITIDEEEIIEISKIDNIPQCNKLDKKKFKEVVIEEIILDEDYASENQEKQIELIPSTQLVPEEQENVKRTHEIVNKESGEIDKLKSGDKAEVKEVSSEQTFDKKGPAEKECILRGSEDSSENRVEEVTIEEVTLDEDLVNDAETVIDKTRRNTLNYGLSESESIVQDGISSKKVESPSKGNVKLNNDQDLSIEEEPENEMDALKKYLESLPAPKSILSNNDIDNSDIKSNSEKIPFSDRNTMESSSMMEDMDHENLSEQSEKFVSDVGQVANKETIGTENLIIMTKEDASKDELKSSVPSAKDIKDHSATISKGDCKNPIETKDNSDNLVTDILIESKESDADEDMTDGTVKPKNSIILLHTFGLQAKREADDPEMKNAPVRKVARKSTSKLPANPVKIITNEISSDNDNVEKAVVLASTSSSPKKLMNPEVLVVDTFETVVDTCESVEVCETVVDTYETVVDNCETNTECNLEFITTNTSESNPSHNDSRNTSFLLLSPEKTMVGSGCSLEEQMVII